jgi:hypothetical protein
MVALLAHVKVPAAAQLFGIQGVCFALYPLVIRTILHRLVPSATRRATTLSIESLACRLAFGPLALYAGWARGAHGIDRAMVTTALLACIPFAALPLLAAARARRDRV